MKVCDENILALQDIPDVIVHGKRTTTCSMMAHELYKNGFTANMTVRPIESECCFPGDAIHDVVATEPSCHR